jgi:hypothetical protein
MLKNLLKIKNPQLLALTSKETGEIVEYCVLRPSGRATATKASSLDLEGFTKKEKAFYINMKNSLMFTVGATYSSFKLGDSVKSLSKYMKYNRLDFFVLSEISE